ncbi:MAG: nucleotidyl transferase AbiEii/AbiGii toxin family protein [Alphaproteobacteria bacterium]
MIGKRELLDSAAILGLNPHVVEKDYALGWALAGIFAHDEIADSWVFKGGTCLKKCFFETYRFSEDLDFTLQDPAHLDEAFLQRVFAQISDWIYERSGLEFPADSQNFDIYKNPRGNLSCQGKLSYRGPISPSSGGLPRIKLDLTADERLVLPPVRIPIFHPYSDAPNGGIEVLAYAYEEAFGEKVRALAERTMPRDLYDVINLYRNTNARPSPSVLLDVLRQKCEFKGIAIPRDGALDDHKGDLEGAWESMLAHQLPALPPVPSFWDALPEFFRWLEGGEAPEIPAAYTMGRGETVIRERTFRLPLRGSAQSHLEVIRFAAANRLCIDLDYQGSTRRIEPYSLRRTQDDNIILHAWGVDRDAHRSYRVDRIEGARTTSQTFIPRYEIELTPTGPVAIPPTQRSLSSIGGGGAGTLRPTVRQARRPARRSVSSFPQGPTYIYQCGLCSKKFRRKTQSSRLNKHKAPGGLPCLGSTGYLVDTKY